ncbi:hypothetical protein CW751_14450 [Brumimicrobium salinarum]|uniref:KAP NTPase domain-containing protein n=1 Tax=Brumimicrobium salinarum TaxID=2058658 RepID=A0A2I0QZ09_9FLAO|nr:P-loop NTPase fold protein [Brumimicrobium salinarum]PKR79547.1 hypothetical protein CW751_14450 [Brumimicrobium salinarum]
MENYISDKTVSLKKDDKFQRYEYGKRIAETISTRTSSENIVFGLYGKWGSGKSSMLKFIEKELDEEKTLQVHFNPWRYKDEDDLLIDFFQTLAKHLDKNIYSRKNRISKFSKKLLSATGELSKLVYVDTSVIGNMLPQGNVVKFKKRTEEFLKLSDKKLVIFIDDIDRLDKDELFTLFRLIKLTADFSNTVYILSFDKEMVAKAIGQRYGNGDDNDGSSFLEKIIQIPIELPTFRYDELRDYTLNLIEQVLNKNLIRLNESETSRFITAFDNCLFTTIVTPRNAKQYYNALEFSIPLMKGEVNIVDLLIFEGIKLFYPTYAEFVKKNLAIFITGYIMNHSMIGNIQEKDKERIKKEFNLLSEKTDQTKHQAIETLLRSLFPKFRQVFENVSLRHPKDVEQSISSADYIERYMSYSLAKNEISDVEFSTFIENLNVFTNADVSSNASKLIESGTISDFLTKVQLFGDDLGWDEAKKIITFIFNHSGLIKIESHQAFNLNSDLRKVAYFTTSQFKKQNDSSLIIEFLSKEIKNIKNIYFLLEYLKYGVYNKDVSKGLFSQAQINQVYSVSITTILDTLQKGEYLFDKYPMFILKLLFIWSEIDSESAGKHIKDYLKSDNENISTVLTSFAGQIYVTSSKRNNSIHMGDIRVDDFKLIQKMNCEKAIFDAINKHFSIDELKGSDLVLNTEMNDNTVLNLANQFLYYYNESLKPTP